MDSDAEIGEKLERLGKLIDAAHALHQHALDVELAPDLDALDDVVAGNEFVTALLPGQHLVRFLLDVVAEVLHHLLVGENALGNDDLGQIQFGFGADVCQADQILAREDPVTGEIIAERVLGVAPPVPRGYDVAIAKKEDLRAVIAGDRKHTGFLLDRYQLQDFREPKRC